MRLQRFLSIGGVASRRDSEQLITAGRVRVNHQVVTQLGTQVSPEDDIVTVDGNVVQAEERHLYLLHKPAGVISTLDDPFDRRCLSQYTKELPVRVYPVGRLDQDVVGLVVLTNDGSFANQLLHPRYEVPRVYQAVVSGRPTDKLLKQLTTRVRLGDGVFCAERVREIPVDKRVRRLFPRIEPRSSVIEIVVHEGKKHFVKRLLAAVGLPVRSLARVSFGPFKLGALRPGELIRQSFPDISNF